jgi:dienelactone hydrolase
MSFPTASAASAAATGLQACILPAERRQRRISPLQHPSQAPVSTWLHIHQCVSLLLLRLLLLLPCRPVLFLLNGANVESRHYSTLASHLSARGYTFVASDYYRKLPAGIPGPTLPAFCPKGMMLATSAALIRTLLNHTDTADAAVLQRQGLQEVWSRGIVVVGHSFGGAAALDIIADSCLASEARSVAGLSFCEAYQPSVRSSSSSSSSSNSNSSEKPASCRKYAQQQQQQQGLILGAIVFEGYKVRQDTATAAAAAAAANRSAAPARSAEASMEPTGIAIPPGTFVLFLAGQYGAPKTKVAYDISTASSCSCIGHADFPGLNHYGINDWQGPNSHQMTPCGRKASSDPADFNVSNCFQNGQLSKMAELVDGFIRASLGDVAAQQQLLQQSAAAAAGDNSSSSSNLVSGRARMMLGGVAADGASVGSGGGTLAGGVQQQQQPDVGYSLQLKKQCFV